MFLFRYLSQSYVVTQVSYVVNKVQEQCFDLRTMIARTILWLRHQTQIFVLAQGTRARAMLLPRCQRQKARDR